MAMIPDSKAPEQAWRFMQYIAGTEGQDHLHAGHVPPADARSTARRDDVVRRAACSVPRLPRGRPQPSAAGGRRDLLERSDRSTGFGGAEHRGTDGGAAAGPGSGATATRRDRVLTTSTRHSRGDPLPVPAPRTAERMTQPSAALPAARGYPRPASPGSNRAPQPPAWPACSSARGCSVSWLSACFRSSTRST